MANYFAIISATQLSLPCSSLRICAISFKQEKFKKAENDITEQKELTGQQVMYDFFS